VRAAKVDGNHGEIVDALRAMGCSVQSLAKVGNGCPDAIVSWKGKNVLMEFKQPGEKLNAIQRKWHNEWQGKAHVIYSFQDALMVMQNETRQG
jgi:hypothetical protein